MGKAIRQKGDEIGDTAEVINSVTDVKIFIEHHKSENMVVNKERFLHYNDDAQNGGGGASAVVYTPTPGVGGQSMGANQENPIIIVDDYMSGSQMGNEPNSAGLRSEQALMAKGGHKKS